MAGLELAAGRDNQKVAIQQADAVGRVGHEATTEEKP